MFVDMFLSLTNESVTNTVYSKRTMMYEEVLNWSRTSSLRINSSSLHRIALKTFFVLELNSNKHISYSFTSSTKVTINVSLLY
jgi:hypothetical protein